MENKEGPKAALPVDKDSQIRILLHRPEGSGAVIVDLRRVFHTMREKRRLFAWVLVLCLTAGLCVSLLAYPLAQPPRTVSSVVTLDYDVPNPQWLQAKENNQTALLRTLPERIAAEDLTAPDGTALDLSQITGAYVLQAALDGLTLSRPVLLSELARSISVYRILSEDSRRQQELTGRMISDKIALNTVYDQAQDQPLTYENRFIVTLTNKDIRLTPEELSQVLDRVLSAYNEYLVATYSQVSLPDDELITIDPENNDILECLDQLRTAVEDLYAYCDGQTDEIKSYRSWQTGLSLTDWMETLETARDVNVEYLYSYIYTNSIVRDKQTTVTSYQYQLRNAQTRLNVVNENIDTVTEILNNYKNDEIFVTMQESDTSKATRTTTDYYNDLIQQQADNYAAAAALEITIAGLNDKIESLTTGAASARTEEATLSQASAELQESIDLIHAIQAQIRRQMEEISTHAQYTTYAAASAAQEDPRGSLTDLARWMAVGAGAGALLTLVGWCLAGLGPEFRYPKKEEAGKEAAQS